ncbi:MAG: glycosyl hydrolase, partial [Bacteroidetes bacterium]
MKVDFKLSVSSLSKQLEYFWQVATQKVTLLEKQYDASKGSPVFTVEGRYSTRGWTEWTQGFQYGIPLLVFGATGDREMLR